MVPFGSGYVEDGEAFWYNDAEYANADGELIDISTLRIVYNRPLTPRLTLSLTGRPVSTGETLTRTDTYFLTEIDEFAQQTSFSRVATIRASFDVSNYGGVLSPALALRISPNTNLFARIPVDARMLTVNDFDATIEHHYTDVDEYEDDDYATHLYGYPESLPESVAVGGISEYYYSVKTGVGLSHRSPEALPWGFVFLPLWGQYYDLELYFKIGYESQWDSWHDEYGLDKWFGASYDAYSKVCFGNRFFTGVESVFGADYRGYAVDTYRSHSVYLTYSPLFSFFTHFFIQPVSAYVSLGGGSSYGGSFVDFPEFGWDADTYAGIRYEGSDWGFSLRAEILTKDFLQGLGFSLWKAW